MQYTPQAGFTKQLTILGEGSNSAEVQTEGGEAGQSFGEDKGGNGQSDQIDISGEVTNGEYKSEPYSQFCLFSRRPPVPQLQNHTFTNVSMRQNSLMSKDYQNIVICSIRFRTGGYQKYINGDLD